MKTLEKKPVGSFVADDFRTAAIFSKYGIDFCCKGQMTIEEVCEKKKIDADKLLEELNTLLTSQDNAATDFKSWPLDLLAEYIEKKHHRYVEEKIPVLLLFLGKLCKVHGERHSELFQINELFKGCAEDLTQHMKKEELMLFPFIKKMVAAAKSDDVLAAASFGKIEDPIAMMMIEHQAEGNRFDKIVLLTNKYTPPDDACSTYKATYAMLAEFEQDLHMHIHLENNILFPKAMLLELKIFDPGYKNL